MKNNLIIGFCIAKFEIQSRYARSVIGPFWMVIQNLVYVLSLSLIFSEVFNTPLDAYIPFLAASITGWNFFYGSCIDSSSAMIGGSSYIKDKGLSPFVIIFQCFFRNIIIFAHNLPVVLLVLVIFRDPITSDDLFLVMLGFIVYMGIVFTLVVNISLASAKYHDLKPVLESVFTLLFLGTPITWMASDRLKDSDLIKLNPMYHFISIWRDPLLGKPVNFVSYAVAGVFLVVFAYAAFKIYRRSSNLACYL